MDNYKVLIAEDDKDIAEMLSLYLKNDKFQVYTASNGNMENILIRTKIFIKKEQISSRE